MLDQESQSVESATTGLESQPDSKTRRYDRQLRLWAASGQRALETARVLVLSGSATSASILKNLVLPGIGHFTVLDHRNASPQDAGNNFFLEGDESIGKPRAEEVVRLLLELNDQVEGKADLRSVEEVVENDPEFLRSFSIVIAHNLKLGTLRKLSDLLWGDKAYPPLISVTSAGFMAEFSIQFSEHCIMESHSDAIPSLRIDKPFSSLLDHAKSLDFKTMDSVQHSHTPYVVILVRALEDWRQAHGGEAPKTSAEKKEFKQQVLDMRMKLDEENFEEAEAQAYKCSVTTSVPSDIAQLFKHPTLASPITAQTSPFFILLAALNKFTELPPHVLPLTSTLPDMKADTRNYIQLQKMYKDQADTDKKQVKAFVNELVGEAVIPETMLDVFVKNVHQLKVLHGKKWGAFDDDKEALVNELNNQPLQTANHLAISALRQFQSQLSEADMHKAPTVEELERLAQILIGQDTKLPEESFAEVAGELSRAPTSELPNTAAFVGGMVAQETIKMITKQYVPINGYCVVDLVGSWTGVIG